LKDYTSHFSWVKDSQTFDLQYNFLNDVKVISTLIPLLESQKIVLVKPDNGLCPHCLTLATFGPKADKRWSIQQKYLVQRLRDEIEVTIGRKHGQFDFFAKGPEDLIEHGGSHTKGNVLQPALSKYKSILKSLDKGQSYDLSRNQIVASKLPEYFVNRILKNIAFEMAVSGTINTAYLTDRPIHIEILNNLSNNEAISKRNQIIQNHLTTIVPFIAGLDSKQLLTIREREEDSFIMFRQALNNAVEESLKNKSSFSEKDAKEIYSQVIAPKIARLENKIKVAKSDLLKSAVFKISAWTAAISFGSYLGFIPQNLIEIAKILGLTQVGANAIESAAKLSDFKSIII
jgi:hypothetical protein